MGGWEKFQKQKKKKKKTEIRAEKGQTKKVNLGWHRDRKEKPISAPFIHVGALVVLVHSGQVQPDYKKYFRIVDLSNLCHHELLSCRAHDHFARDCRFQTHSGHSSALV